MKKNTKISPSIMLCSIISVLIFSYIICVYKTVTIASYYEKEQRVFSELQTVIGEKEYAYIKKTSDINMDMAIHLGYQKFNKETIAYIEKTKDTALAIR